MKMSRKESGRIKRMPRRESGRNNTAKKSEKEPSTAKKSEKEPSTPLRRMPRKESGRNEGLLISEIEKGGAMLRMPRKESGKVESSKSLLPGWVDTSIFMPRMPRKESGQTVEHVLGFEFVKGLVKIEGFGSLIVSDMKEETDCMCETKINNGLYFEIQIISKPDKGVVAIGLGFGGNHNLLSLPGWGTNTVGIHSDGGGLYYESDDFKEELKSFKKGDIIGIGMDKDRKIYQTKNGKKFNSKVEISDFVETPTHCLIGMDLPETIISVNNGTFPFVRVDHGNIPPPAPR